MSIGHRPAEASLILASTGVSTLRGVLNNACGRLHAQGIAVMWRYPSGHLVCVTIVCTLPYNLSVCVTLEERTMDSNGICVMSVTILLLIPTFLAHGAIV